MPQPASAEREPQPRPRIFLVEAHQQMREAMLLFLKGQNRLVITAQTAEAALELLEVDPEPALVITDLSFRSASGKLSGIDLARKLRSHAQQKLRQIPLILFTGESRQNLELDQPGLVDELGISYFSKDEAPEKLESLIDSLLNPQP